MSELFKVRAIGITRPLVTDLPTTEDLMVFQARVSNPKGQARQLDGTHSVSTEKFIHSVMKRGEWSVFQMVNINLEMVGPRDVLRQFTRHESIAVFEDDGGELLFRPDGFDKHAGGVQEFSQRYASAPGLVAREGRGVTDDRQVSEDNAFYASVAHDSNEMVADLVLQEYQNRIAAGEHPETARVILPEGMTLSHLYLNGTVRSWLHYLQAREAYVTQKEHRKLAGLIRQVLHETLPLVFEAPEDP